MWDQISKNGTEYYFNLIFINTFHISTARKKKFKESDPLLHSSHKTNMKIDNPLSKIYMSISPGIRSSTELISQAAQSSRSSGPSARTTTQSSLPRAAKLVILHPRRASTE